MPAQIDIKEIHWLLDIVQCIDVGVVVVDRQYRVEVWNSFMENHSGLGPDEVHGKPLFELFAEIDETWLRRKVDSVVQLGTRAFSLWEQRPYLMRFDNYQPITGEEAFMYQNVTLLPWGRQRPGGPPVHRHLRRHRSGPLQAAGGCPACRQGRRALSPTIHRTCG